MLLTFEQQHQDDIRRSMNCQIATIFVSYKLCAQESYRLEMFFFEEKPIIVDKNVVNGKCFVTVKT